MRPACNAGNPPCDARLPQLVDRQGGDATVCHFSGSFRQGHSETSRHAGGLESSSYGRDVGVDRRGQRCLAFGYGALRPSASGTSPRLNTSLPSAHYGPVRLPRAVHRRRVSWDFPTRPVGPSPTAGPRLSRLSREVCPYMLRVSDRAGLRGASRWRRVECGLPLFLTAAALQRVRLSRLNTRPARSPVNASPAPLRASTHDSGPLRRQKALGKEATLISTKSGN
jgi:hypothetical protein